MMAAVLVTLPSGARMPLSVPTLSALMMFGAGLETISGLALAHPQLDAARLGDDDRRFVCEWAVAELARSPEAIDYTRICERFGCLPSDRLRFDDAVLAFGCDRAFVRASDEAAKSAQGQQGKPERSKVAFSVDTEGAM